MVHADDSNIQLHHLPPEIRHMPESAPTAKLPELALVRPYYRTLTRPEDERETIARVLAEVGGSKAEAARRLNMSRTTLWKKLKKWLL